MSLGISASAKTATSVRTVGETLMSDAGDVDNGDLPARAPRLARRTCGACGVACGGRRAYCASALSTTLMSLSASYW